MKKVVVSLALMICLGGCETNYQDEGSLSHLKDELKKIVDLDLLIVSEVGPASPFNSVDSWGEQIVLGISTVRNNVDKAHRTSVPLSILLAESIPKEISESKLYVENPGRVSLILDEFLRLFIEKDAFTANYLSFKMERIVISSNTLGNDEKEIILKLVSVIRHVTFHIYMTENRNAKGEGDYEKCWKRKLEELDNSGIFTKLVCVYGWPVCLGALALDCVVEVYL